MIDRSISYWFYFWRTLDGRPKYLKLTLGAYLECCFLLCKACSAFSLFFFFFFGLFLGLPLGHMEVPRLEVKSQPQLPVQATATVSQDLSHVCDLHHHSHQCRNLNSLRKVRDQTHVLMDISQVSKLLSHDRNSSSHSISFN